MFLFNILVKIVIEKDMINPATIIIVAPGITVMLKTPYFCLLFSPAIDVDECLSEPCLNGATCTDLIGYYRCECDLGYDGTNCETGTFSVKI